MSDNEIVSAWRLNPEIRYAYYAMYTQDPVWRAVYRRRLKQVRGERNYP